nr:DUF4907 domain-containing protein [uncultured Allomuricauda sp.]
MKWFSVTILLLLFIGLLLYLIPGLGTKEEKSDFKVQVVTTQGGFGYRIFNGEKILIKQDFIPAVQGDKPFATAKDAQLIGNLVAQKLSNSESPVVHLKEIENLNITLPVN